MVTASIREHGPITVAGLRDLFGTSRRYALPLLAYLDEKKITRGSATSGCSIDEPSWRMRSRVAWRLRRKRHVRGRSPGQPQATPRP